MEVIEQTIKYFLAIHSLFVMADDSLIFSMWLKKVSFLLHLKFTKIIEI